MELYLFLALLLIYILTAFMVKKVILHKIWTLAFILAFVVTAVLGIINVWMYRRSIWKIMSASDSDDDDEDTDK